MAQFTDTPIISDRFANAVLLALHWHKKQIRKNGTPYMSHLMQVAGLVLEHNGTEDEAIAAILHDSVEDLSINPEDIRERYGEKVFKIVMALTEDKSLSKSERKSAYVDRIAKADYSIALVSCADKLHNLRCYRSQPELVDEQVELFYSLLIPIYNDKLRRTKSYPMVQEMDEIYCREILLIVHNK